MNFDLSHQNFCKFRFIQIDWSNSMNRIRWKICTNSNSSNSDSSILAVYLDSCMKILDELETVNKFWFIELDETDLMNRNKFLMKRNFSEESSIVILITDEMPIKLSLLCESNGVDVDEDPWKEVQPEWLHPNLRSDLPSKINAWSFQFKRKILNVLPQYFKLCWLKRLSGSILNAYVSQLLNFLRAEASILLLIYQQY